MKTTVLLFGVIVHFEKYASSFSLQGLDENIDIYVMSVC